MSTEQLTARAPLFLVSAYLPDDNLL